MNTEFDRRYRNKFYGKHRAVVTRTDDPEKRFRVKVRCPDIYGNDDSPWAEILSPFPGAPGSGFAGVPSVQSVVFIECEAGIPERPVVTGGLIGDYARGRKSDGSPIEESPQWQRNKNTAPSHASGIPDGSDLDGGLKGRSGVPESAFAGKYPHVKIWTSASGHFIEMDDTPGAERVQISHANGAHIEIRPDGSLSVVSSGKRVDYAKSHLSTIDASSVNNIGGNLENTVAKAIEFDAGTAFRVTSNGEFKVTSSIADFTTAGAHAIDVGGVFRVKAGTGLSLSTGGNANIGALGNMFISTGGYAKFIASNAFGIANPLSRSLDIEFQNGTGSFGGSDPTGLAAKYGIEVKPTGVGGGVLPTVGVLGPYVRLGSLVLPPSPDAIPLLQEPGVLGMQLFLYLTQLHTFLQAWMTDYIAHAHPPFSPSPSAPAVAAAILPQLVAMQTTYLTPTGAKVQPLLLSDSVFLSKT